MASREIKTAITKFVLKYFDELIPNGNKQIASFLNRKAENKIAIAPSRLVDKVDEMLSLYRERGKRAENNANVALPIFILGFDKNYAPTGLERGASIVDKMVVEDDEHHYFYLRLSKHEQRAQLVLFCRDEETAFLFADQFKLYCAAFNHRTSPVRYFYNGKAYEFKMILEDNNIFGANNPIAEQENLTVLVFDLNFICQTPYFSGYEPENNPYLPTVKMVNISVKEAEHDLEIYHKLVTG